MRFTGQLLARAFGAVAVFAVATTVSAQSVTFSTLGSFGAQPFSATPSLTVGGYTITFNGLPSSTVATAPAGATYTSLGFFRVTGSGPVASQAPLSFSVRIIQSNPGPQQGEISGTLAGTISFNSSQMSVTMSVTPLSLDPVIYAFTPQTVFDLVPPTTNNGETTLQAFLEDTRITGAVIPEPSTYALMATGLGILGGVAARRRRREA